MKEAGQKPNYRLRRRQPVKNLLKMFLAVAVILGLIFINVGCRQAEQNAEVKDVTKDKQEKEQNAAQEYADKLLKAKQDAKEAANATEQSQKDVNKAIGEIDKENNGK